MIGWIGRLLCERLGLKFEAELTLTQLIAT